LRFLLIKVEKGAQKESGLPLLFSRLLGWKSYFMKKYILSILVFLVIHGAPNAQTPNYKVVFDMSSNDSVNQQSIVREIGLITDYSPDAKLEVVIYGKGMDYVVKGRSPQQDAIQKLITTNKAAFKVCEMTMKRNHIDQSQLIPGVEIVPDGIYEIISKQQQGWGYIKVGH
jgi:uncharacterized protein